MQQHFVGKLVFLMFSLIINSAQAEDALSQARDRFLDARDALNARQLDRYEQLAESLHDYPLYPYLEYWYLQDRLIPANQKRITAYIREFANQPTGELLRRAWLNRLASRQDWPSFIDLYSGSQNTELQCHYLTARLSTRRELKDWDADALKLWMVGRSQDSACDPAFARLEKRGLITNELRWQRIRLAMKSGNTTLASWLGKSLPQADRKWVDLWIQARKLPAGTLDSAQLATDSGHAREIVLFALHRLARADLDTAQQRWQQLRSRYHFTETEAAELDKDIALVAGWRHHPDALAWLSAVPEIVVDSEVRDWRVRSALRAGDWSEALRHIEAMPEEDAGKEEWRYWRAVSLENTGASQAAKDQLAVLARERDYHGFLAADELQWPYVMDNRPIELPADKLQEIRNLPGIVRARELSLVGLMTESRREWAAAIRPLSALELKLAAQLASEWGWHDRAILTVARSEDYDDLELRFPLDYETDVKQYAEENQLDPGHVYAVIRTESAFNKDARSGAGAMGLMQLMPATGRITARKNSIPLPGTQHLYEPERNIRIGTAYLRQVMDQYDSNVVLASAAYNAGPHRVQRWLPDDQAQPASRWIASIPFDETRKYVQRILAYAAIYDWRLQRPIIPLADHMPDIHPGDAYSEKSR